MTAGLVPLGDSLDDQRVGRRVSGEIAQHHPQMRPSSEGTTARKFVWT